MKIAAIGSCVRLFSTERAIPKVCIVGAGPAGFYAAQQLLKTSGDVHVDVLEKLPVPFGLVRFGVAPDHPEVKNVIHTFEKTASNPRFQFIGNVNVGKDVSIQQLQEIYHAVLLTYGAEEDKQFNIPGENLENVISGRRFVGWYNGVPADSNLKLNLDVEEAVVLGQGNVAIDIARILLTPVDKLRTTDITSFALEQLSKSKVRKVSLVGRRGPLQAAFTIAELREIIKLDGCKTYWRPADFVGVKDIVESLARPRRRLTELMLKSLGETPANTTHENFVATTCNAVCWSQRLLRSKFPSSKQRVALPFLSSARRLRYCFIPVAAIVRGRDADSRNSNRKPDAGPVETRGFRGSTFIRTTRDGHETPNSLKVIFISAAQ
ncbi:NADPH:adrenodoxin oxidoreductase, mitochondrial isoform X2 [Halictus rubicundus]|uniref:NADPH:adrenodoxin oxidoreductase, mitochondrial isoform X2 n=1 Tax=Halictus rubicundus TaxID=77578 RepID=UPI004035FA35